MLFQLKGQRDSSNAFSDRAPGKAGRPVQTLLRSGYRKAADLPWIIEGRADVNLDGTRQLLPISGKEFLVRRDER